MKWTLLTLALKNFNDKLILSDWNWRMPIFGYEESRREQVRLEE